MNFITINALLCIALLKLLRMVTLIFHLFMHIWALMVPDNVKNVVCDAKVGNSVLLILPVQSGNVGVCLFIFIRNMNN